MPSENQTTVLVGDARSVLASLPEAAFQCCVTSPPYYWQRDYGHEEQIGLEATPEGYVAEIVAVFQGVRRVLRDDGVAWLNLGDAYYSGRGQPHGSDPRAPARNWMRRRLRPLDQGGWDIPKKSLLGLPWMVAHALQRDGWTIRQEVIWVRDGAHPEPSVKDRPHRQHETVFLLSKSRFYFFDRSALPEESVWHIPHQRGLDGHSAAYPVELASRCIAASTRPGEAVLDPFGGAGTTGVAARRLGRSATLVEINPDYAEAAERRITGEIEHQATPPLLAMIEGRA